MVDCLLPPRNKLFGKHCGETIVGVIRGLVLSHFCNVSASAFLLTP